MYVKRQKDDGISLITGTLTAFSGDCALGRENEEAGAAGFGKAQKAHPISRAGAKNPACGTISSKAPERGVQLSPRERVFRLPEGNYAGRALNIFGCENIREPAAPFLAGEQINAPSGESTTLYKEAAGALQ